MPERIQLSRKKGSKKPAEAIVVSRPSMWGNPWSVVEGKSGGFGKTYTVEGPGQFFHPPDESPVGAHKFAVALYRQWLDNPRQLGIPAATKSDDPEDLANRRKAILEQLIGLSGFDLACWCPASLACHADVLLTLANPEAH